MPVMSVPISAIELPTRIRVINPQRIAMLKDSMANVGLINPITVYKGDDGELVLAAGAHRIKAAKALGWPSINASVVEGEDIDRLLMEIDENLCRSELSATERAIHVGRRKELWIAKQAAEQRRGSGAPSPNRESGVPELGGSNVATQINHVQELKSADEPISAGSDVDARGQHKSVQQQPAFAASTAAITGESKSATNRHLHRRDELGDAALRDINGTSLDKGVELDALIKLDGSERKALVARARRGEKVSARKPLVNSGIPEVRNWDLAIRAVSALEKCADAMNKQDFDSALKSIDVSETAGRFAYAIVQHARRMTPAPISRQK